MLLEAIVWAIEPKIKLGPITTSYYGILFALGFIIGYQIVERMFKKEKRNLKDLEALTLTMVISTIVGARLGHCFFYDPEYYLSNPLQILYVWKGGLASHGAAIGILIGLYVFTRIRKSYSYLWVIDRISVVVALAGSFIRLGNFFNSEIYGHPTDVAWGVIFKNIDSLVRHPVQLYESIAYLAIFIFLLFKYRQKRASTPNGLLFGYFLVLVFGARIWLEAYKVKQAAFLSESFPITMGQILSIPFVIAGIYFLVKATKKKSD